jgi:hypothetical protein|tara:strand:+ start:106 stop:315 length:210 start_codon:yes stop_codon:yes gene_type:complete
MRLPTGRFELRAATIRGARKDGRGDDSRRAIDDWRRDRPGEPPATTRDARTSKDPPAPRKWRGDDRDRD